MAYRYPRAYQGEYQSLFSFDDDTFLNTTFLGEELEVEEASEEEDESEEDESEEDDCERLRDYERGGPKTTPSPEIISKDELSFVEEVPKQIEIECPVCLNILTNPHQVSCCGKNFCGSCIERVKDNNGSCPMCNHSKYQSFPDKNVSRIVNGLRVYCTNKKKGCQWKGDLKDLLIHLKKGKREGECQFEEVKCQYDKCQTKDQRQNLLIHEKDDCNERPYKCEHCAITHSYTFIIGEHLKTCRKYPTKCPNDCSKVIPKESVPDHLTQCPLQPVDCEFSWAGCNDKPLRKDVDEHTNDTKHMTLLAVACGQLKKENARMFAFLGVINNDTYPILPVTVSRRDDVVHFYTELGGHHMSAVLTRSYEGMSLLLAFHEGKFDGLCTLDYLKVFMLLDSGDAKPVPIRSHKKLAHDVLGLPLHQHSIRQGSYKGRASRETSHHRPRRIPDDEASICLQVSLSSIKLINIILTSPNEVTIVFSK
ncbi:PREDICTED: TNF receptor-associated factor 4-like [Amphimedon queenslandica]|uniref:RING-type domain-containing protein n=2 Tax=Amphimedon queenslandica TaxID=400682 RepID=A0A1X7UBU3_AMPQE|nr:PREDICTED: TNF receptor-associated factor 4-like [Amphimedon queenslandica]|eukprot:XP_019855043.1 PREDICTED: TNF receptor-associated factor 4-like [Amphimedon queenslandica]